MTNMTALQTLSTLLNSQPVSTPAASALVSWNHNADSDIRGRSKRFVF